MPPGLQDAYLAWLAAKPGGIGYLEEQLSATPPVDRPGRLDRWFCTLELLARFPSCGAFAKGALDWIVRNQDGDGFWDFGPRGSTSSYFPLADSWRKKHARKHDWSTRVLVLLAAIMQSEALARAS